MKILTILTLLIIGYAKLYSEDGHYNFKGIYNYKHDQNIGSVFDVLFSYHDPFLFNSNDIALDGYFYGPQKIGLSIKKWGFNDYALSLGVSGYYSLYANRNAEFIGTELSRQTYYDGSIFRGELFEEYELPNKITEKISFGIANNIFAKNDKTPSNYILPTHSKHIFTSFQIGYSNKLNEKWNAIYRLEGNYIQADTAVLFGILSEEKQPDKLANIKAKLFFNRISQNNESAIGLSAIVSEYSNMEIGTPAIMDSIDKSIMYGFSENAIPFNRALLFQGTTNFKKIVGELLSVQLFYSGLYSSLTNSTDQNSLSAGGGIGLEIPISIPMIGLYSLRLSYLAGYRLLYKKDSKQTNQQINLLLYTYTAW